MRKVSIFLARLIGFHFVPENHKAAVMRFGMYHRARGPGFVWVAPFVERVENLVKIGMRLATLTFKQVLSSDGVFFDFELAVLYRFDPDSTSRPIAAQLVRLPDHTLENIVKDYADQSLRRTVAHYSAEDISMGAPIADIEQDVIEGLRARVRHLGLALMADRGVMIKEITPPEDFMETMLRAKENEMILRVLTTYQAADVDQALLAELVRSFKDAPPGFLSRLAESIAERVESLQVGMERGGGRLEKVSQHFLAQAGFTVRPVDPVGLLCTSDMLLWADVSPLYVRLVLERMLDLGEFQSLCTAAEAAYGEDLRGHTAAVVIDRPPRAGDLHQIFALRAQRGLTVVPMPLSLMAQAQLDGREMEALKEQIGLYTGREDLYNIRGAVTDVLSFFGRSRLLVDLKRQLTSGQSAVVFGVRKMGKSSLLGRLREECTWPVALVDLQGYARGVGHVYGKALRGWRTALQAAFSDLKLPEWTGDLSAPEPTAQAQTFRQAVGNLLDLLAAQPGQPGLLLFLDEIDIFFDQPEYLEFAAMLRSVAEDPHCRGRFALLAAGLEPTLNRLDRIDGGRNPFYAFFGEIPLWLLKPEDTRTMIVSIGNQMGISYEDEALDLLVQVGGGHPFLTRQLCSRAIRDLRRPGTVDMARATRSMEDYLRLARNYFAESLWGIDSGGPSPAEALLLRSLADAQPQPEESLVPPNLPPEERRARQLALDHLYDQSLIRRVEDGWELTIPLYRRWIRHYILNLPDEAAEECAQ